jgi:hypothetical protein
MLLAMSKLLVFCLLIAGCATDEGARKPVVGGGPQPHYNIHLQGPNSDEGKQAKCVREIEAQGGVYDPNFPLRAEMTLFNGFNKLQLLSPVRGLVYNEDLPGWGMTQLCQTAIQALARFIGSEPPPGSARPANANLAAGGPPALAPPPSLPEPAAGLTLRGQTLYAQADYTNALGAFASAHAQYAAPALLFNMAACQVMLNQLRDANRNLQIYLDRAPQAPNRIQAEQLMSAVRRSLGDE